ncbi:MAG TPA: YidB family protein [Hyphomicrobiales bacterium]|nr:YidB family protein [Hyphomicrobiales bacterium]
MGLFDGILGGMVGAEMIAVVNRLVEKHGGLQGVASQLQQQGLGATVKSWIENGPNQPISPDQVNQAFGSQSINDLAARAGMTPQELAAALSAILPTAIDKATPGGSLPKSS